jgi:putative membrane protein
MTKLYNYLTLLLIGIYVIYLFVINRLAFLIHPRYLWFTLGCGGLLALVGLIGIISLVKNNPQVFNTPKRFLSWSFVILVLVAGMFFVPIKSLSIESFNLRNSKSAINFTDEEKKLVKLKLNNNIDSSTFKFFDWINAKSLNENGVFKDKKFKGSGFITAGKTPNTFELSRFVISCCVVDATPVSLTVEYNYQDKFKLNDWVEIDGAFAINPIEGKNQPVIIPTSINKIPEPDSIYLDRT